MQLADVGGTAADTCCCCRLKLVSVLLNPETGPVLREQDPATRQHLLGSLSEFQQERRATAARTSQPRQPAPAPAQTSVPSAPPFDSYQADADSSSHSGFGQRTVSGDYAAHRTALHQPQSAPSIGQLPQPSAPLLPQLEQVSH